MCRHYDEREGVSVYKVRAQVEADRVRQQHPEHPPEDAHDGLGKRGVKKGGKRGVRKGLEGRSGG
jgi:hypothetical protein